MRSITEGGVGLVERGLAGQQVMQGARRRRAGRAPGDAMRAQIARLLDRHPTSSFDAG